MNISLEANERLDYLLAENLRIIQSSEVFSFSLDAVLLAQFASIPYRKTGKIIDLCTGNGVIPLLLSARSQAHIWGIELQPRLASMAKRSVAYNHLDEQLTIIEGNVIGIEEILGTELYDTVTCNPPYFIHHPHSEKNISEHYAIARHEIELNLEQAIQAASRLLKQGGKAVFVHRPGRLADFMEWMPKYRLEPKRIRFVHPKEGKEANILLIEAIKDGKRDLKIEPPLIVYTEESEYRQEVREWLYGK